eukprot:6738885-Prymnesium_polylepis.1
MSELAHALQSLAVEDAEIAGGGSDEQQWAVAECRRAQLEELECLEAMFPEEFLLVSSADAVASLREARERLGDDAASADAAALRE